MDILNFLMFVLFPLLGLVGTLVLPIGIIIFWKRIMPKAARTLFWSARRNKPPALIVHDSGRAEFTLIEERRGSGVVVTEQGKYKLVPRYVAKRLPEAGKNPESEGAGKNPESEGKDGETETFVRDYSDWIVKRAMLIGLDKPIFVGYSGKMNLLNPEALALYEAGELYLQTEDGIKFNPNKIKDKDIKDAMQPLMLIDARKIKEIINEGFDDAQIAAVVVDSELIGLLGRGFGRYIPIMILVAIIIAAIAAIALLPMFLPQMA